MKIATYQYSTNLSVCGRHPGYWKRLGQVKIKVKVWPISGQNQGYGLGQGWVKQGQFVWAWSELVSVTSPVKLFVYLA